MTARGADVVVVGAGVVGASVAYHLTQAGAQVAVVDRREIASGATGTSAGFVRFHHDQPALTRLARAAWSDLAGFEEAVGGSSGFVRTGCLERIPGGRDLDRSNEETDLGDTCSEVIDGTQLHRLFPRFRWPDDARVIYERHAGYADPRRCVEEYVKGVVRTGGSVHTGVRCLEIQDDHGRVSGVVTSAGSMPASIVVIATGAWSAGSALVRLGATINTKRIVTQRVSVPPGVNDLPAYVDEHIDHLFFRPNGEGELVVGGGEGRSGEHPDDPPRLPGDEALVEVLRRFERFTGIRASCLEVVSGLDAYTPDGLPVIDRYSDVDGVWIATGFSGTGFKTAPAVGRMLGTWIANGVKDKVLDPFSLNRFASPTRSELDPHDETRHDQLR